VSRTSHRSSILLSPTTLTHVGHTHRTTIPSLLSERHKLAPSGSPAGAVLIPRPVPAVKTLLGPQHRVKRLPVCRSRSTSATATEEDRIFQISDSSSEIEVSRPPPLKRHVSPSHQFRLSAYVRSGAAALAPPTLWIPFLDPIPAISDSWIPIHIVGKIPRSGGAVLQDLDMGHPQLMPLKM
jgi:hypothetical protein